MTRHVKVLHPSITGPYEFDEATGMLTVALVGCEGGPYLLELANPRETAHAMLKACEGKLTAYDRWDIGRAPPSPTAGVSLKQEE